MNNRNRGKITEREAAHACREYLHSPDSCMRTRQAHGKHDPDIRDVVPGFRTEVKGRKTIAVLRHYEKTESECLEGERPLVLLREKGKPHLFVMLALKDVEAFVNGFQENRSAQQRAHSVFGL